MLIPPGFNTIAPYLFAQGAQSLVDFLVRGLGGVEVCRTERPDGLIQNVQVQIGSSTVMVSEATPRYPAMCSAYYLYVVDADAAMAQALAHGGRGQHALRRSARRHQGCPRQHLVDFTAAGGGPV